MYMDGSKGIPRKAVLISTDSTGDRAGDIGGKWARNRWEGGREMEAGIRQAAGLAGEKGN